MKLINPLDHPICFARPFRLHHTSAWIEHVPFAMFLIDVLRPKVVVELGTHTGVSYCAFCQAVKQLGLSTRCYAVDTWEGDFQAGFYGPDVLTDLRTHHDPLYGKFSCLMQSTFDDAVKYFSEGSIDLLHIDGLHTYEAVKHDFEIWFPKLSKHAVVLFHDTNVRERDFGIWKLWEELQQQFPHFDFFHGHGLGVLGIGSTLAPALEPLFFTSNDQRKQIREFFFTLGSRLSMEVEKEQQLQLVEAQINAKEQATQLLTIQMTEREQTVQALMAQIAERDGQIANLKQDLTEAEVLKAALSEREAALNNIYGSHGWKALLVYYRLRERIFPINTKRRALAKLIFRLLCTPRSIFQGFKNARFSVFKQKLKKTTNNFHTTLDKEFPEGSNALLIRAPSTDGETAEITERVNVVKQIANHLPIYKRKQCLRQVRRIVSEEVLSFQAGEDELRIELNKIKDELAEALLSKIR